MTPNRSTHEWRFGESEDDAVAWSLNPSELHVYVDVRTPATPPGCWHRIWAVTESWAQLHLKPGSIVPAILVVRDGSLEQMRAEVDALVGDAASLIALNGTLLPADHKPVEW